MSSLALLPEPLASGPARRHPATCAADLATPGEPLDAGQTNNDVLGFLTAHPGREAAVVVDGGRPIGLINRHIFMESYARPFARDVFGRRSCIAWMDKSPLVVDSELPVAELVKLAVATGQKALKDGFIVVRGGQYQGHGSGFALLQAISALEAEKTAQLRESISYASRIQRSYLRGSDQALAEAVADGVMRWEPRDVVGGDCYFFRATPAGLFGAVVDCTGHGVPGAFMTLIALSILDEASASPAAPLDPGAALGRLNTEIKRVLGQGSAAAPSGSGLVADDGLDAACFWLPRGGEALHYAGARLPLLVARPGEEAPEVVEPDRLSVGYLDTPDAHAFATRRVATPPGTLVAVATDGIIDQIGGPRRVAFGRRRVLELLGAHRASPAREVAARVSEALATWQGEEARRDDVALLVVRVDGRP